MKYLSNIIFLPNKEMKLFRKSRTFLAGFWKATGNKKGTKKLNATLIFIGSYILLKVQSNASGIGAYLDILNKRDYCSTSSIYGTAMVKVICRLIHQKITPYSWNLANFQASLLQLFLIFSVFK